MDAYFHDRPCSNPKPCFSDILRQIPYVIHFSPRRGTDEKHFSCMTERAEFGIGKKVLNIKTCEKGTRRERAFRLVQIDCTQRLDKRQILQLRRRLHG